MDFSATSNIPTLTPQPETPKEIEKKPAIIDIKPPQSSTKTAEVPTESPIKETIRVLPSKPLNNSEVR